ncbi:hypothetical protein DFH07DRAFT_958323 [Mycena maculata]|uniref:Uncharacterized protein n=1 Tax=Mycena maculata TaxID=230809 RepID=A0AAD7NFU8_9AGAR|nr:hypothetical protein DFH07DRAFT_958323 [Mycena maculata]
MSSRDNIECFSSSTVVATAHGAFEIVVVCLTVTALTKILQDAQMVLKAVEAASEELNGALISLLMVEYTPRA